MAEGEGLLADPEPFSPSVFLDLPPTPRPDGTEDPVSSDDLILPFISRMLMEEDIGDQFFYQYPEHPALLQAQQPFADILSDAATNSTSSGSTATLSPSSPDDPIQLPHLLQPAPHATAGLEQHDGVQSWALLDDADEEGRRKKSSDGDQDQTVLASAFFSGNNKDILNQAFLKGKEEANKLLPTNSALLVDQVKETNGGGRKKTHNWDDYDDLEAETCRKSKLMVPEPEETGEVVDEMIVNAYDLCLKEMESLRITMGSSEDTKKKKEKKKKGMKGKGKGSRSRNEAVDLSTLLIHCAQAVATDNRRGAAELLRQIRQHSSPRGDATQRLAHVFAEGLEARLAGSGSQLYASTVAERVPVTEYLKACWLYLAACCFEMVAFKFSIAAICNAAAGRKKLHIVDYGVSYGFQWPTLLRCLANREGGPPEVRITGIDLPQPGFRPAAQIEATGRRLSNCARQFGVAFKFRGIAAKWETIGADDLDIDRDEVLIVNSVRFQNLMDEGADIDSPSPRDIVLGNIRKMRPDMFILFTTNVLSGASFFLTRFREALFYYSAMFDMLDATAPRDSHQRLLVERGLFRPCALNAVACEGSDRVERPETYKQWQARSQRAGLKQLPLDPDIVRDVREMVREQYHKDFAIDVDHHWLLEGWKGRVLYAMSTWVADDAM
ncbi:hypothetical protein PVAP13_8KG299600 [Panicum virgatum]|uniref:Scarecrow-like protein 9 n=2 Tax=Panicum virgatum TaxID=38727 RepID=A0A8T0PPN1_PANVG|nr:hypothetical protein PVAP13_8KG299600 [Panicum virgatum]